MTSQNPVPDQASPNIWTSRPMVGLASTLLTTVSILISNHYQDRSTKTAIWQNTIDQDCYIQNALTQPAQVVHNNYTVKSKTCPTGNTFVIVTNTLSNHQYVDWISFGEILTKANPNVQQAQVIRKDKKTFIFFLPRKDGKCNKQIIAIPSGKILSDEIIEKCPPKQQTK